MSGVMTTSAVTVPPGAKSPWRHNVKGASVNGSQDPTFGTSDVTSAAPGSGPPAPTDSVTSRAGSAPALWIVAVYVWPLHGVNEDAPPVTWSETSPSRMRLQLEYSDVSPVSMSVAVAATVSPGRVVSPSMSSPDQYQYPVWISAWRDEPVVRTSDITQYSKSILRPVSH